MELNYYEIQVYNEITNDFDIFIVMAISKVNARLEYYDCFMESYHNVCYMSIKKLEDI